MTFSRKYLLFFFTLPIILIILPMGMGNGLAQPVSLFLLLPILMFCLNGSVYIVSYLFSIFLVSFVQSQININLESSWYQFLRSGIPFVFFCMILFNNKLVQNKLVTAISHFRNLNVAKIYFICIFYIYAAGQFLQVLLFFFNIELANAASKTDERVLLFPTTATVILFLYAFVTGRLILMSLLGLVLLSTGSKTILATMIIMVFIGIFRLSSIRTILKYLFSITIVCFFTLQSNALILERVEDYLMNDKLEDITRAYEIHHAKESLNRDVGTVLFGNGLLIQLTPGVPSDDEKWFENSKYDIENGYWGVFSKLGLIGSLLFLCIFIRLPKDFVSVGVIVIWIIFSLKSSYQFFTTFDGCYLLLMSIFVRAALKLELESKKYYIGFIKV